MAVSVVAALHIQKVTFLLPESALSGMDTGTLMFRSCEVWY